MGSRNSRRRLFQGSRPPVPLGRLGLLLCSVALAGCQLVTFGLQAQPYPGETWSLSPRLPDPVLTAAAPRLCGASFDISGDRLRVVVQAQHSSHRAAFILRSLDGVVECVVERPPIGEPVMGSGGSYSSADATVVAGQTDVILTSEAAGPPVSVTSGRAGPGIAAVRLRTTNSGVVEAAMGEGWFLAMWPGVGQVESVEGLDGSGAVVSSVPGYGSMDLDWLDATPFPTMPASVSAPMAGAIEAAEPFATELSQTPARPSTVFPVDLADYCDDDLCPRLTGLGWGALFDITAPDGQPATVLVVLDADLELVLTQQ